MPWARRSNSGRRAASRPFPTWSAAGRSALKPGQWTDDTSMALCLAESLVECEGFDPADQMRALRALAARGLPEQHRQLFRHRRARCRDALRSLRADRRPLCRVSPTPIRRATARSCAWPRCRWSTASDPAAGASNSCAASSRTTHGAGNCVDACRYLGGLIVGALNGVAKEILLAPHYAPLPGYWAAHPLAMPKINAVASGSFKNKSRREIKGSGYVVQSLEAALWAFQHRRTFATAPAGRQPGRRRRHHRRRLRPVGRGVLRRGSDPRRVAAKAGPAGDH